MLAKFRPRSAYDVMGALALFIVLGGTSYALAAGSIDSRDIKNNSIRSNDIRNNQVSSVDVKNGSLLAEDFRSKLPLGPPGLQGPPGPKGTAGEPATKLWGVVNAACTTVQRGAGIVSVSAVGGGGRCDVKMARDVTNCAAVATLKTEEIANAVGTQQSGQITASTAGDFQGHGSSFGVTADEVTVSTTTSAGASDRLGFNLALLC